MNRMVKTDKKNTVSRLIFGMGGLYLLFLIWAILWKCGTPFLGDGTQRTINLLPFNNNTPWELQFNIAVFVPFGFCLSAVKHELNFIKLIAITLSVSFALEAAQFILAIGRSDITDLLMNTLGGIIGMIAFYVLSKLFGKHERKASVAVCALLTLFEMYMTVSFIFFGQLNLGFMIIKIS